MIVSINSTPFLVDFNSSDEDNAVWLPLPCKTIDYKKVDYIPEEGQILWVSDGDIEFQGKVTFRVDRWVVIPNKEGYRQCDNRIG